MLCLDKLRITNFRNYAEAELKFHRRLNIILGDNAQGKTNMLEAIAYLSMGSSFREVSEEKLRRWGEDFFYLRAELMNRQGPHTLAVGCRRRQRLWKVDDMPCRYLSEIAGLLHTVVFTPEDLDLVKKGPEVRRFFLDREMIQLFRGYHVYLNNYKKALLQRNNLLRQADFSRPPAGFDQQLEVWEEQLAQNGGVIIRERSRILEKLEAISREIQGRLTDGGEELELKYTSPLAALAAAGAGPAELAAELRQAYAKGREEDKRRRLTLFGPHRDDFHILINGVDGRHFASQGQQRTAALALKLSELELVQQLAGYYPLLLLDDVFSELDAKRRQALLRLMLDKAQIFITATEIAGDLRALPQEDYNLYRVSAGQVAL